jgi:hypothetical protein
MNAILETYFYLRKTFSYKPAEAWALSCSVHYRD